MTLLGRFHNGVIVFDQSVQVPEGTIARVELLTSHQDATAVQPRQGGQWKGKVVIAPDFDLLPDDMQEAFGMNDS